MSMNPRYPVFVISKGRWKTPLTIKALIKMGVPFKVVVEPQEAHEYVKVTDQLIITPFNNLGLGSIPVRNYIWELMVLRGIKRYWLLDDNIEAFNRLNRNKKPEVYTGAIFRAAEDFIDRYENVPLAGFNYYSFCKATEPLPPYYLNTRVYSCSLIETAAQFRWRGRYNEDTDLSLRILKAGYCTILFNAFLAGKVTTMRMKGGNTDELYADDGRKKMAESLVEQHPDVAKVVWKFGRWHHQVNYKPFKNNKLIKKDIVIKKGVNNYGMILND